MSFSRKWLSFFVVAIAFSLMCNGVNAQDSREEVEVVAIDLVGMPGGSGAEPAGTIRVPFCHFGYGATLGDAQIDAAKKATNYGKDLGVCTGSDSVIMEVTVYKSLGAWEFEDGTKGHRFQICGFYIVKRNRFCLLLLLVEILGII